MTKGKLSIVWGGQFGSEGKGQIAAEMLLHDSYPVAMRIGGPNAGHTFYLLSKDNITTKVVVQSIPVATYFGSLGLIGPAGYIILDLLIQELQRGYEVTGRPLRLMIDPMAVIISIDQMEKESVIKETIGSTGEGVGAATADKIWRKPTITVDYNRKVFEDMAENYEWARGVSIGPTSQTARDAIREGKNVMIEGTQGYGLSLHTGGFYPFCTSRECTPQSLMAETGLGMHLTDDFESIMVLRTFPIRVGGNSGPLAKEINWETLNKETNGYVSTPERTTVTKKVRRIARFDPSLVLRAIEQCGPTSIALNFLDYLFPDLSNCNSTQQFPTEVNKWLSKFESDLGVPIKYVSWGPGISDEWRS